MSSKKVSGADAIPANILKEVIDILRYPLKQLFNLHLKRYFKTYKSIIVAKNKPIQK